MNLPFPWLGAGMVTAAAPAMLQKAGKIASQSTAAFGDLLSQVMQKEDNGPSETTQNRIDSAASGDSSASRKKPLQLFEIQQTLKSWITEAGKAFGMSVEPGAFHVEVNQLDELSVRGPEPIREALQKKMESTPEMIEGLKLERRGGLSPLSHLPGTQSNSSRELLKFSI